MKSNFDIESLGGNMIVPVFCEENRGTAFFVDSNRLLTAWHVVSDGNIPEYAATIIYKGISISCSVAYVGGDIALLTCEEHVVSSNDVAPLLACRFVKELPLKILGFPEELGNGVDYFIVDVKNKKLLSNQNLDSFDTVAVRTDSIGFCSYVGFSGSPVLDEFGHVLGVVTDQFYNSLSYSSLFSVADKLEEFSLLITKEDDLYDTTPLGLGYCTNELRKSIKKVGNRYAPERHIENKNLEKSLRAFCRNGYERKKADSIRQLTRLLELIPESKAKDDLEECNSYKEFQENKTLSYSLVNDLDLFYDMSEWSYKKLIRQVVDTIERDILSVSEYAQKQFGRIEAPAGCGKTHMLCHITECEIEYGRIYFCLGTEFQKGDDAINVICNKYKWKSEDLVKLNDRLKENVKYATFIIDAINEGVGTDYWEEQIPKLENEFKKYSNFKLLISMRQMESTDHLSSLMSHWVDIQLDGFENINQSIKEYIEKSNIAWNERYLKVYEFKNPLFLSVFCSTFHQLSAEERETPQALEIYRSYLRCKNRNICNWVDADSHFDLTELYLDKLAALSVKEYVGGDLPRLQAHKIGNRLCRYRTWSQSLLHAMLKENLLLEYSCGNEDFITFEYDSMGDFMKADKVLQRYKNDKGVLDYIISGLTFYIKKQENNSNYVHFQNLVVTLLSMWKPDTNVWVKPEFQKGGVLEKYFLSSLNYSPSLDEQRINAAIQIIEQHNKICDPLFLLKNLKFVENILLDRVFEQLTAMSLHERDLKWTTLVNSLYDRFGLIDFNAHFVGHDLSPKVLQLVCWLLTSSYPAVREFLVRVLKTQFDKNSNEFKPLFDIFKNINDPYVIQGLLAAVYGALLVKRDVNLSKDISNKIIEAYYIASEQIPMDIETRRWSMLIVQLAGSLDETYDGWNRIVAVLKDKQCVSDIDFHAEEAMEGEEYFGTSYGSKQLHSSLYNWDFARYVIGINSFLESNIFINSHNDGVRLRSIQDYCAYIIKSEFEWTDELSIYDSKLVDDGDRFNHKRERIGKKYQWLAYFKVLAILTDSCKVKVNIYSDSEYEAEVNYPWYAGYNSHFDPTLSYDLSSENQKLNLFVELFGENRFPLLSLTPEWFKDDEQELPINMIITDKHSEEWVVLNGLDSQNRKDIEGYGMLMRYESVFVPLNSKELAEELAKKRSFYDDHFSQGCIDFLWNEYPWSDTYQSLKYGQSETVDDVEFWRTSLAQLQENLAATESPKYSLEDSLPNEDVMKVLNLHTAERGIVRDEDNRIVAMNIHDVNNRMNVLIIKRAKLNEYLDKSNKVMFYQLYYVKEHYIQSVFLSNKNISFRYMYSTDGEPVQIVSGEPNADEPNGSMCPLAFVSNSNGEQVLDTRGMITWLGKEKQ